MNTELKTALEILEKEKDISKDVMLDAIENSLITACQSHFGKEKENFRVEINRDTCDFHVYAEKTVVEQVEDPDTQISMAEAKLLDKKYELGDIVLCAVYLLVKVSLLLFKFAYFILGRGYFFLVVLYCLTFCRSVLCCHDRLCAACKHCHGSNYGDSESQYSLHCEYTCFHTCPPS